MGYSSQGLVSRPQVLRGATLYDGTVRPGRRADVRFEAGRITDVGQVDLDGADLVDLDGLFLTPGFIDPHTHFDAQVTWDPDLTPSTWHGVTTVVMGNCGFGVAPTRPEHRGLICRTLENVEGMSLDALEAGIDWSFESFPEYMALLERIPLRPNVAVLMGHTPIRLFVMGEDASRRAARPDEVQKMCDLLRAGLQAGALGFATSRARGHMGAYGQPVPSRLAALAEIEALVEVLGECDRGIFQAVCGPDLETPEVYSRLAERSGRPITWIPLFTNGRTGQVLDETDSLPGEVWPQMACRPIVTQVTMANPTPFLSFPSFSRVLAAELEDRMAIYKDYQWRDSARPEADARWGERWSKLRVKESRRHADLIDGPSLAELAAAKGLPPFDLLLDLSLEEGLQTRFELQASNDDMDELAALLADDRTVLGLSDAGAHARELCDACYPSYLLGEWVRERGAIGWEDAVWRLSGHPAQVFRIPAKGRVAPGFDADLVAFDPSSIGPTGPERVHDLPGGADRLVVRSRGVEHVWINGERTRRGGVDVAASYPGRVIKPRAGE